MAVLCVTLTWTTIVPWDDANLIQLVGVLLGVILVVGGLGALALHLASRFCCAGARVVVNSV